MLYPIGIQNFENLRNGDFVYVDKTALIYKLVKTFPICFLSRPRRFGKSLLLSTMEAYFKGKRELFHGLAMENLEKDWIVYPVIHIDLNNGEYGSVDQLKETLSNQLTLLEKSFGVEKIFDQLGFRFEYLIKEIEKKAKRQVVILIDEYDKPMLEIMSDEEANKDYSKVLKPFYGTLKKCEGSIRFIFITGVTKFAKLSVFSDLNQLKDISLLPAYDTLCGITRDEMLEYFSESVKAFAQQEGITFDGMVKLLEKKYDGYHFSRQLRGVFNPFSLLNAFSDEYITDYWIQTATPSFLAKELQMHQTELAALDGYRAEASLLTSVESMQFNPVPVIYQSGYITIKDYEKSTDTYILGYPNEEVEQGFLRYYLHANWAPS